MFDNKLNLIFRKQVFVWVEAYIALFKGWNLLHFFFPPESVSEFSDPLQLSQMKGSYYGHQPQQGSPQHAITLIGCTPGLFSVLLT